MEIASGSADARREGNTGLNISMPVAAMTADTALHGIYGVSGIHAENL